MKTRTTLIGMKMFLAALPLSAGVVALAATGDPTPAAAPAAAPGAAAAEAAARQAPAPTPEAALAADYLAALGLAHTAASDIARAVYLAASTAPVATVISTTGDKVNKIMARKIVVAGGHGSFLGIGVADLDANRAKELGLKDEHGVEITSVVDGSAAAKAGLKEGDVILEYNGQRVEGTAQFIRMVRETPPGRQVKLTDYRGGRTETVTATIGTREPHVYQFSSDDEGDDEDIEVPEPPEPPEPPEAPEAPSAEQMKKLNKELEKLKDLHIEIPDIVIPDMPGGTFMWRTPRLGVETESLGAQLSEFFGVKGGVLVKSVIKGSAAEKAGIKAGDVIVKVGDRAVMRSGDISSELMSKKGGEETTVTVVRNGKEKTFTVKIDGPSTSSFLDGKTKTIRLGSARDL